MGLGRNVWHFLSFISAQLSASHASSGAHTTPLASSETCAAYKTVKSFFYALHSELGIGSVLSET